MIVKSSVPTLTYLRKYALWREKLPLDGAVDITGYGTIPRLIANMLEGKIRADPRPEYEFREYNDELFFLINERRLTGTRRYFLSPENVRLFNQILRDHLRETLIDRIDQNAIRKTPINQTDTIKSFMHELLIVDDISYDALTKGLQRYRKSKAC